MIMAITRDKAKSRIFKHSGQLRFQAVHFDRFQVDIGCEIDIFSVILHLSRSGPYDR